MTLLVSCNFLSSHRPNVLV